MFNRGLLLDLSEGPGGTPEPSPGLLGLLAPSDPFTNALETDHKFVSRYHAAACFPGRLVCCWGGHGARISMATSIFTNVNGGGGRSFIRYPNSKLKVRPRQRSNFDF